MALEQNERFLETHNVIPWDKKRKKNKHKGQQEEVNLNPTPNPESYWNEVNLGAAGKRAGEIAGLEGHDLCRVGFWVSVEQTM